MLFFLVVIVQKEAVLRLFPIHISTEYVNAAFNLKIWKILDWWRRFGVIMTFWRRMFN